MIKVFFKIFNAFFLLGEDFKNSTYQLLKSLKMYLYISLPITVKSYFFIDLSIFLDKSFNLFKIHLSAKVFWLFLVFGISLM